MRMGSHTSRPASVVLAACGGQKCAQQGAKKDTGKGGLPFPVRETSTASTTFSTWCVSCGRLSRDTVSTPKNGSKLSFTHSKALENLGSNVVPHHAPGELTQILEGIFHIGEDGVGGEPGLEGQLGTGEA